MAGQARGRARTRAAGPVPAEETGAGAGQAPQYLIDLLAPLTDRLRAVEDFMSGFVPPPPAAPEPAVAAVEEPVAAMAAVSRADQEMWMRLVERYQKMRAPEFQGSTDPLVADKWKEDVSSILSLMGVDRVQR